MNQLKSIYNIYSKIRIHTPFTPVYRWLLVMSLIYPTPKNQLNSNLPSNQLIGHFETNFLSPLQHHALLLWKTNKVQSDDSTGHEGSVHALTQLITDFSQYLSMQCSTKCPIFKNIVTHKKELSVRLCKLKNASKREVLFRVSVTPALDFL